MHIDKGDAVKIPAKDFSGTFQLPLQPPGKHTVVISAIDNADNRIEDIVPIEILPIASPRISFVTSQLFSNDWQVGLNIKGTGLPKTKILLKLDEQQGGTIAQKETLIDDQGNWVFNFEKPLSNGTYVVKVQNQDDRGALSLVVVSDQIHVTSKPVIQVGFLQLGPSGALLLLLMIIAGGFGGGIWFYKKQQEKLTMRVAFTESEITKIFQLIRDDAEQLYKSMQTPTTSDDEYAMKRLQENIQKMETYLKRGIEKIKR